MKSKILKLVLLIFIITVSSALALDRVVPQINAHILHEAGITGSGYGVCLIDTGIVQTHENLVGGYVAGTDKADQDSNPYDAQEIPGHGTKVAGIIISDHSTYRGVAYEGSLAVAKIRPDNYRTLGPNQRNDVEFPAMAAAIDWCIGIKDAYNIKVITTSMGDFFGTNCPDPYGLQSHINDAISNGIAFVAAEGNSDKGDHVINPACLDGVIAVGSSTLSDKIQEKTIIDDELDILAPSNGIKTTRKQGGILLFKDPISFTFLTEGTSYAAPQVAAAYALLSDFGNGSEFNKTNFTVGVHELTLTATDGDDLTGETTVNLTVNSAPPDVTIISPSSGDVYQVGGTVLFNGTAADHEDGSLSGSSLVWTSDKDGVLGTGNNFTLNNLTSGFHIFSLNATDSHSVSFAANVTIPIVGAGDTTFTILSDGSSTKNLTYDSSGSQVVYIRLPKTVNVTGAILNISGYGIIS